MVIPSVTGVPGNFLSFLQLYSFKPHQTPPIKKAEVTKQIKARKKRISQFIEYLKTEQGYSLSVVAQKIGISVQGLYKINRGDSNLSRQTIMLLGIKYDLNSDWFRTGKGDMLISRDSDKIEKSDEILLELIRMKNALIEELICENEVLKKEQNHLEKRLRSIKKSKGK